MSAASRRGLLGGLAALVPFATQGMPVMGIPGRSGKTVTVLPSPEGISMTAIPLPDAELLATCREYIAALKHYDEHGGHLPCETCPLWQNIERLTDRLAELEPTTVSGLAALASVSVYWATQLDGSLDFDTGFVGHWPERLVMATLRIAGQQA